MRAGPQSLLAKGESLLEARLPLRVVWCFCLSLPNKCSRQRNVDNEDNLDNVDSVDNVDDISNI